MSNRPRKPAPAPMQTVVIAHLHPGTVSAYFLHSLTGVLLYDRKGPQRIVGLLQEWSSANVSGSRNNLTRQFLEGMGDWLLWIDSDMSFQPDAMEQLLASADAEKRPIIGGLCFGSANGRLFPTVYQWGETETKDLVTWTDAGYRRDSIIQVGATGAAFLLVHRSALETMRDRAFSAVFPWFQEMEMNGKPAGEDITFCLRAGICQLPVFVNTAVKVGHHKSQLLTEDLFISQRTAEGAS
jgi:hypothetical protein